MKLYMLHEPQHGEYIISIGILVLSPLQISMNKVEKACAIDSETFPTG